MSDDFELAVKYVAETKTMKATNEQKLSFYKYYKQATVGDCNTKRPGVFEFENKAKWDSWDSIKGMSKDDAKAAYVKLLTEMEAGWKS